MLDTLRDFLRRILHLEESTDVEKTIRSIREGIPMRGYNIWILVCSAMLASIGLDTNSEAVIIGAMLISPLMSPILGIGLSVGMYDRPTLLDALKHFGTAVAVSLVVSTLYFIITPLGAPTEQILARTQPTTLDIFVAIFGGIAGIVAGSRKDLTNAIPGVAIATALMPPLCVAGFGLSSLSLRVFGGAFYLFLINAIFIALSTFLVVRYLRFPLLEYVDQRTRRRAVRWIGLVVFLAMIPSGIFLYQVVRKVRFQQGVGRYLAEVLNTPERRALEYEYFPSSDSQAVLKVYMSGTYLGADSQMIFQERLSRYGLDNTRLELVQNLPQPDELTLRDKTRLDVLRELQPQIDRQAALLDSLRRGTPSGSAALPEGLAEEMRALFPGLAEAYLAPLAFREAETGPRDTLQLVVVRWKSPASRQRRSDEARMEAWLRQRLGSPQLELLSAAP